MLELCILSFGENSFLKPYLQGQMFIFNLIDICDFIFILKYNGEG